MVGGSVPRDRIAQARGFPWLPGSRVFEVPNGIAFHRADAPIPRADRVQGQPRTRMLTSALWSALAVCPQTVRLNTARVLRFSLST